LRDGCGNFEGEHSRSEKARRLSNLQHETHLPERFSRLQKRSGMTPIAVKLTSDHTVREHGFVERFQRKAARRASLIYVWKDENEIRLQERNGRELPLGEDSRAPAGRLVLLQAPRRLATWKTTSAAT
jgi:hypothetical protein